MTRNCRKVAQETVLQNGFLGSKLTLKKVGEGKLSEAQVLFSESEAASLATEVGASTAEILAFETRSFAVQAEMIAAELVG